jgi:hypothetical protein
LDYSSYNYNARFKNRAGGVSDDSFFVLVYRNFFLPPVEGSNRADLLPGPGEGGPELMPVLRHGPTIAHMVDTAMSSSGKRYRDSWLCTNQIKIKSKSFIPLNRCETYFIFVIMKIKDIK